MNTTALVADSGSFVTAQLIMREKEAVLDTWMKQQLAAITQRADLINAAELRAQSEAFLDLFVAAIRTGNVTDISTLVYQPIVKALQTMSAARALQGFSPTETATFVFSLKEALLPILSTALASQPELLAREAITINLLLDKLGLVTFETYAKSRETVINRQATDMLNMASPVIQVWDRILAVPLIGTLDSRRSQLVMESLLNRIVATGSAFAIIDITGVLTVDTMVAQYLLKTVAAIRLVGADSVITGISAPVAQTMAHLGIDLSRVVTRAVMADGIRYAMAKTGQQVSQS